MSMFTKVRTSILESSEEQDLLKVGGHRLMGDCL